MRQITPLFINKNIKNLNDLEKLYQRAINKVSNFSPTVIDNKLIRLYYQFCIQQDIDIDEFMRMLSINEEKQSFLARAQKTIEQCRKAYLKEIEANLELSLYLDYDNYSQNTIKQICSFITALRQKNTKSFDIKLTTPENGFRKSDLESLLNLSQILNQDLIVTENQDEIDSEVLLSKVIEAYGKMDGLVERINSLNLSPFEKFLLVHDYAANRIYKNAENDHLFFNADKSRSFVNVMTSDTIVCVGYAQIVKEFCKRLGIECEYISGDPLDNIDEQGPHTKREPGHAANIVHIVDEKYGIDGFYFCDACWDSRKTTEDKGKQYFYSALPIQDMDKIESSKYFSHVINSLNIPKSSKPIPVSIFRHALNTIYSDTEQVEENLQNTIKSAYHLCAIKSDNDFMQEYFRQREKIL